MEIEDNCDAYWLKRICKSVHKLFMLKIKLCRISGFNFSSIPKKAKALSFRQRSQNHTLKVINDILLMQSFVLGNVELSLYIQFVHFLCVGSYLPGIIAEYPFMLSSRYEGLPSDPTNLVSSCPFFNSSSYTSPLDVLTRVLVCFILFLSKVAIKDSMRLEGSAVAMGWADRRQQG